MHIHSSIGLPHKQSLEPSAFKPKPSAKPDLNQGDIVDYSGFPDDPALWEAEKSSPSLLQGDPKETKTVKLGRFRWSRAVQQNGTVLDKRVEATIDFSKVKKAYFVTQPFQPTFVAGHSLIAFECEPGGVVREDGTQSDGFVVSMEAWKRKGDSYGLIKGMKKAFKVSMEVGTWDDQCDKMLENPKTTEVMRVYPLNVEPEEAQRLARVAVDKAVHQDSNEWYHTLLNSCHTRAWEILDSALGKEATAKRKEFGFIPRLLPLLPGALGPVLEETGLLLAPPVLVANKNSGSRIAKAKSKVLPSIFKRTGASLVSGVVAGVLGGVLGGALGRSLGGVVGASLGRIAGALSGSRLGYGLGRHAQLLAQGQIVDGTVYSDLKDLATAESFDN